MGGQQSFADLAKDRAQDRVLDGLPGLAPKGLAAPGYECPPSSSSLISSWEPAHPAQRQHGTRHPWSATKASTERQQEPVGHRHGAGSRKSGRHGARTRWGAGSGGPAQDDARGGERGTGGHR